MLNVAFCFLCEQGIALSPEGTFRDHNQTDPCNPNVVAIRRCSGSGLSPSTTRSFAAMNALRGRHNPDESDT